MMCSTHALLIMVVVTPASHQTKAPMVHILIEIKFVVMLMKVPAVSITAADVQLKPLEHDSDVLEGYFSCTC